MPKVISALLALAFFLWILPLGVFIKNSQEKIACDGQRAFCMCHHADVKSASSSPEEIGLKNTNGSNKESPSSSGAGNYFLALNIAPKDLLNTYFLEQEKFLAYSNPFLLSIEQVPKA